VLDQTEMATAGAALPARRRMRAVRRGSRLR